MKPVIHQDLKGLSSDTECTVETIKLFMDIFGAVAYALMIRIGVAVFVTHKPNTIHTKRLNAVLRWMQANPKRLTFRPATPSPPTTRMLFRVLGARSLEIKCVKTYRLTPVK